MRLNTLNRLLLGFALFGLFAAPVLAAPRPISLDSPVAGNNVPTTDGDGNTVQAPAQLVQQVDAAGNIVTGGGDANAANQTTGNATLTAIDGHVDQIEGYTDGIEALVGTTNTNLSTINTSIGTTNTTLSSSAASAATTRGPVAPATATATASVLQGCQYNSTLPTFTDGQQGRVGCTVSGGLQIGGASASGGTAAGNPVLAGCDYNTTTPTYTNGQRGAVQCGTRGSVSVQLMAPDAGVITTGSATADDVSAGTPIATASRNFVYDPTDANWDRQRMWQTGANISSVDSGLTAVGLMAQCDDSSITATTENQAGNLRRDCASGALITRPYETQANSWSYAAAASGISNTTTAVTIKASAGGTLRNCLTSLQISAGTLGAATEVAVRDGAGGTVVWRGFLSTSGGNQSMSFQSPVCGTAATLMEVVTLSATVTGAVYINAQGFAAP